MRSVLSTLHPAFQILGLILFGFGAMFVLWMAVAIPYMVSGVSLDVIAQPSLANVDDRGSVWMLRFFQMAQSIGLFVAPFLAYRWYNSGQMYGWRMPTGGVSSFVLFCVAMVGALPFINLLVEWNSSVHFPAFLSDLEASIRRAEASAEALIEVLISVEGPADLVFSFVLLAFVPALSEELMFRGAIQPIVIRWCGGRAHVAIWLTAFLFSFLHLQFLGFIPRMVLGAALGYAAHWSGTLWLPIVGHMVYNASSLVLALMITGGQLSSDVETLGATASDWWIGALSAVVSLVCMVMLHRRSVRRTPVPNAADAEEQ